jgi:hypothetical protein
VTLARTLGISLVWLVAGEGAIMPDMDQAGGDDQYTTETTHRLRLRPNGVASEAFDAHGTVMDTQRLQAAMRILQSELDLAGNPFSLADSTDLLTSLYEALGPGGTRVDTSAMLTFNRKLAERIRHAAAHA